MLATRFSRAAVLGGRAWPHAAARVGRVPRVLAPVQPPFRNFDVYGEGRRSLSMSIQQRSQVEMLKARVAELRARDSELASSIEQLAAGTCDVLTFCKATVPLTAFFGSRIPIPAQDNPFLARFSPSCVLEPYGVLFALLLSMETEM